VYVLPRTNGNSTFAAVMAGKSMIKEVETGTDGQINANKVVINVTGC
jgi:hypothetical protein